MEIAVLKRKIPEYYKKYKFVLLILLIGLVLMMVPSRSKDRAQANVNDSVVDIYENDIAQLKQILGRISGAGRVEVLLTKSVDRETDYQLDEDYASSESGEDRTRSTVIITDADKNEAGLVQRIKAPVYRGAVIVCDGADDPSVRLAIFEAVSKVTGLSTNHIAVLKME